MCYYTSMIVLLLAVVGLSLGSFVNAFVWRLHEGKDWINGRSECPHCHHQLAAKDLVPVVSWLLLRGKCRYCHKPIPDSPLVEILVALLFVLSYIVWPLPLSGVELFDFVLWLMFVVGFVALAVYDLRWFLLPNIVVFPLIGLAAVQVAGDWFFGDRSWSTLTGPLIGAATISGLFYALFAVSKGTWIGFGDVKLGIALGLLAGGPFAALLVLLLASLIGTLAALPLVLQGKATRKSHLPFGPLLIAGIIIVTLCGESLIDWYAGMLAI
jgi:prepilin signal peptidase PulO-like enzyme (type II secretory pathway)